MKETHVVEQFDQLGEVGERLVKPVDLVDDDDVNPSRPYIISSFFSGRALHRATKSRHRRNGRGSASSLRALWSDIRASEASR